jgi:Flp pilus assembly protein TadB
MLGFVILLVILGCGFGAAAVGWTWFGESAAEANHRRELERIERDALGTPQQQATRREAVWRAADDTLDQHRRKRGTRP